VFTESVSANCRISQVVRQRIPHQRKSVLYRNGCKKRTGRGRRTFSKTQSI